MIRNMIEISLDPKLPKNMMLVYHSQDKFLYCPFCGQSDIMVKSHNVFADPSEPDTVYVEFLDAHVKRKLIVACNTCCCKIESNQGTIDDLKVVWNTRAMIIEKKEEPKETPEISADNRRKLLF